MDEAILTGETHSVSKTVESLPENTELAEQINMAFSGTKVESGNGLGVVVEVGSNTQIGKISYSLSTVEEQETPLLKKIKEMNTGIFKGISALILLLALVSYFYYGMTWGYIVTAIIALIVSSIPEGLPSILTIILSIGVNRMAKKNAIVKTLPTVETLGAMTVICSDKTGTLTKNEMSLVQIATLNDWHTPESFAQVAPTKVEEYLLQAMHNCQETQLADGSVLKQEMQQNLRYYVIQIRNRQ